MRRTKEDAEKTRLSILDAAIDLFANKGVAHTSLEEIAKAAGVTRGAVYWHFKNKGEIFDNLHAHMFQPVSAMIMEDVEEDHDDPVMQLQELCQRLLLDLADNRDRRQACRIFITGSNYVGEMAQYRDKHYAHKMESMNIMRGYFEKAKARGRLPKGADPEVLIMSVRFFIKGVIVEYLNYPEDMNLETMLPPLMEQFFKQFKDV